MLVSEKNYFTKKDINKFFKNKFDYSIFQAPAERFKDLYSTVSIDQIKVPGTNEKTIRVNAIKKSGKMFTYDKPIVPISIYILPNDDLFWVRFIAHTIDDSSMGFWKALSSVTQYESFLNNVAIPYLQSFEEMPSLEEFEKHFKQFNVEFDHN